MRDTTRPDYGKPYVFFAKANDPHRIWAEKLRHGVMSSKDRDAKDSLNPPLKTNFQQGQVNRQERVYASTWRAPLGTGPNDAGALPDNLDKVNTTFGVRTEKGNIVICRIV
jgi:hypothetical protein